MTDEWDNPLAVVARYQEQPPVDLDGICRDLGIKVYRLPLGSKVAGQLIRDESKGGFSGFAIYINSSDHPNRRRFTQAHELAHFILHRDLIDGGIVDDTMYRSDLSDRFEVQANRMAADILMPVKLVKRRINAMSVDEMAKLFQVSEQAMRIRVEGIQRLSQGTLPGFG